MTLEEQIREAVKYGITHLTLAPTWSSDGKTTYWRASATPSTMHKYVTCSSTDPIEALIGVLKAMPKAPAHREPKVTATVTAPEPDQLPIVMDETAENLAKVDEALNGWMLKP